MGLKNALKNEMYKKRLEVIKNNKDISEAYREIMINSLYSRKRVVL